MIEARRTRRDELRPAGGQLFQDIAIDDIVDDDADGRESRRQRDRPASEERVEVYELVSVTGVQLIEQRALVALRAEHCDPHVCSSAADASRMLT